MGDTTQALEQLHGIPCRDPTSYRPLAEFCFGIPDDQYLRNGQTRWLARRMLKGLVPELVRTETRHGLQGADWELRLGRQKDQLSREISGLMRDPAMARRFNLPSMKSALDSWVPGSRLDVAAQERLELAIPRALVTAHFIRYVEGKNDDLSA